MDLLENIAQELEFDFHLYIVADGLYGTKVRENQKDKWNGVVGDLVTGTAHMSFAALSVSSTR
jgi:Ligated ion channel L-glutamate- and glycine-binding site.